MATNMEKLRVEAILFDLDGTMWDSTQGVLRTWNEVVTKHPGCRGNLITSKELSGCFGLPMTEIAKKLFPAMTADMQQQLITECCELENAYLSEHGGILYPQLERILKELKSSYKLFVVSNCQQGYIESFIKAHGLENYFDDIECWGNNFLPKGENNKLIMKRNNVTRAVYVGDTSGDEESARVAGIPFIWAAYGFGRAVSPDYVLTELSQLPKLMEHIV